MRCQGQGDVFLAERAYDVHLLNLNNSGLSISGKNVLAFSSSLDWNIERVKGGSIATGGLFNTTLRGTGWVAMTTDGPPVVLNAAEAPTFADTNAVGGVVGEPADATEDELQGRRADRSRVRRGGPGVVPRAGLRDRAAVGGHADHGNRVGRSELELHRHRAVVDEFDLHVRADTPVSTWAPSRRRRRRRRSPEVRRPRPVRRRSRSVACPSRCWRTG